MLALLLRLLDHLVHTTLVVGAFAARQTGELVDGVLHVLGLDGLEQVVDAVDLEGLKRIFVVCRGEDYRGVDLHRVEYAERLAVGQMYVHEYEVGRRLRRVAEVVHRILYALQHRQHFVCRGYLAQYCLQVYGRSRLVFDYEYFHRVMGFCRGRRTVNSSSVSII